MAVQEAGIVQGTMEKIVAVPFRATITVGFSIIVLLYILKLIGSYWPPILYFNYLVPFIPPFFITRTAKRINQKRAEYDFIKDAEPYIFVAFPTGISEIELLATKANMISDSASRHFNKSTKELLKLEALPKEIFNNPVDRDNIAKLLVNRFIETKEKGAIKDFEVFIKPFGSEKAEPFLLNSVLKMSNGKIKWQATIMKETKHHMK